MDALRARLTKKDGVIASISEEYVSLKNAGEPSEQSLGPARHAGLHRRLRAHLVRDHRDPSASASSPGSASSAGSSTTGRSATARPTSTTAWSPRPLARAVGARGDPRLPSQASTGGLPPAHLHDDRHRYRRRVAHHGLEGPEPGRRHRPVEQAASKKGKGFVQPLKPHEHWHIDISYLNLAGTFYFLCSVLDGYSRAIVHWEIRETMTEKEVQVILQQARELYPEASHASSATTGRSSSPAISRTSSSSPA